MKLGQGRTYELEPKKAVYMLVWEKEEHSMAKIKINEREFEIENLSDGAKANIGSLQFVQKEINQMKARIAVYKAAESNYIKLLQDELFNEN